MIFMYKKKDKSEIQVKVALRKILTREDFIGFTHNRVVASVLRFAIKINTPLLPILNNRWNQSDGRTNYLAFNFLTLAPPRTKGIRSKFPASLIEHPHPPVDSSSRFVGTIKRLIARSFVRGICVSAFGSTVSLIERHDHPLQPVRIHKAVSIFSSRNIPVTQVVDWTVERQR